MDLYNVLRGLVKSALIAVMLVALHAVSAGAQQRSGNASPPGQFRTDPLPSLRTTPITENSVADRNNRPADFDTSTIAANDPQAAAARSDDDSLGTATPNDTLGSLDLDQRSQTDRDVFNNLPAGGNPRLFQIERIEPIRDRRTLQFFELEPFPHLGWRVGSFTLFQEFQASPTWDSNVFLDPIAQSDSLAEFSSETRLVSNWSNHALEFRMLHDRSYYRQFTTENEAEQTYELRGRLDVTSRTTAEVLVAREIRQESRNSIDTTGATINTRPNVVTDRVTGVLNHRFNRLSLQLRGGHAETTFADDPPGTINDRNIETRTVALRAQWEFRPAFSVFGEIEHDDRRHPSATTSDGLIRNSDGERYRVGVALGQTGEFLRGEASIGYGIQRPDETALTDIEAFLVDANVAWRVTPLTSVLFEARTGINETTVAGSPGVVDRRLGIRLRHSFSRRFTGETGVSYGTQDFRGATLNERDVTFNANVEYSFNRHAALFSRYEHVRFRSNAEDRDYNASTLMFGARLRN